ncbi:MAG: hypothetical protein JWN24_1603 [Phycisphaerales bacterium]|nr:hypothetical protein [Phycisphaerales bacterium]
MTNSPQQGSEGALPAEPRKVASNFSINTYVPPREPWPRPNTPEEDEHLLTPERALPEMELLRAQQRYALEDIMNGKTYEETAKSVNISRRTLYRWIKHDKAFKVAMEAWRQRALLEVRDRLTQGAIAASHTVVNAASRGSLRASLALLKGSGLLHPSAAPQLQPPPPKTPPPAKAPPTGKFRVLEMRLRELLLSLTDAPAEQQVENVKQVIAVESKQVEGEGPP